MGRLLQGRLEEGPSRTEYKFFGRDGFDGATTNYNANCSATRFALQGASNLVTTGCNGHVVFAFTARAGVKRDDSGKEINVARQKNTVFELTSTMTERRFRKEEIPNIEASQVGRMSAATDACFRAQVRL